MTLEHRVNGVSIHAPAKGRLSNFVMLIMNLMFQSTPLQRGDSVPYMLSNNSNVSIHAPAKGRPENSQKSHIYKVVSIHAPAKGRLILIYLVVLIFVFQSTPLQRGDL